MIRNFIFKGTSLPTLERGLNAYSLREKVIAENIANVNTPGYKKREVTFEDKLQSAIQKVLPGYITHEKHIPVGKSASRHAQPQIVVDNSNDLSSGVNNVSIEDETVALIKNQIQYMYSTRMVSREFASIRASIKGRFDR